MRVQEFGIPLCKKNQESFNLKGNYRNFLIPAIISCSKYYFIEFNAIQARTIGVLIPCCGGDDNDDQCNTRENWLSHSRTFPKP